MLKEEDFKDEEIITINYEDPVTKKIVKSVNKRIRMNIFQPASVQKKTCLYRFLLW